MNANSGSNLLCVICGKPAEYFCLFCNSSGFCENHFCKHVQKTNEPPVSATEGKSGSTAKILLGLIIAFVVAFFI